MPLYEIASHSDRDLALGASLFKYWKMSYTKKSQGTDDISQKPLRMPTTQMI